MEVMVLKSLADKMTKGKSSEMGDPEDDYEEEIVEQQPKKRGLNPLRSNSQKKGLNKLKDPSVRPDSQLQKPPQRTSKKVSKKNRKRRKRPQIQQKGTQGMSLEEIARQDLKQMELYKKPVHEMTDAEKIELNKIVEKRHKRPKPPATFSQESANAHYENQAAMNTGNTNWMAILKKAGKL